MLRELEGLGQETHWDLYSLNDYWYNQELRINPRNTGSPKIGKKVVTWTQVSPSQIENYIKCPRAWYFKSVARIPEPQKGHQALGSSFHLIMEKVPKGLSWPSRLDTNATDEEWDKAKQMANNALPLLPLDPEGKIKREHGIILETYPNGPLMKGYVDLALPPGIGWPAFMIPSDEAIIGDYKTLSDFRYMKTPEELANSIQMMSYAKWAITNWPSGLVGPTDPIPEHVRLLHIYARTKAPFNRSSIRDSSAVVSVPEINSFWERTLDIVKEMESTATCQSADDVEAKGALNGHCEAYGGCHFRDKCGLAKEVGIPQLFQVGKKPNPQNTGNTEMSGSPLLQKILAARAAATGNTSQQTSQDQPKTEQSQAAPVAASTIPAKGPISGLLAKIQSTGHGTPNLAGSVAQQLSKELGSNKDNYPGEGFRAQTTISSVSELMKYASGIVPPDAPPRTQEKITTPGMAVTDPEAEPVVTVEEGEEDAQDETPSVVAVSVDPVGTTVSTAPVTPVEGKKRGRPSKEEMQAREAAQAVEFAAKVEAEVQRRLVGQIRSSGSGNSDGSNLLSELSLKTSELQGARDQLAKAEQTIKNLREQSGSNTSGRSADDGLTLYIDCMPIKGDQAQDFYDWVRPATQAVEEANGVADWRMINYTSKALLATQIRELIKLTGLPKALAIPSFAGGADIALEILSPLAKKIIRPLR